MLIVGSILMILRNLSKTNKIILRDEIDTLTHACKNSCNFKLTLGRVQGQ